jgi:hypothetical protein
MSDAWSAPEPVAERRLVPPWLIAACTVTGLVSAAWLARAVWQHGEPWTSVAGMSALGFVLGASMPALVALFGAMGYSAAVPGPPQTALLDGEEILVNFRCVHWVGIEGRGGRLRITDRRILFDADRLNIQREPAIIDLGEVTRVSTAHPLMVLVERGGHVDRLTIPKIDARGPAGRVQQIGDAIHALGPESADAVS